MGIIRFLKYVLFYSMEMDWKKKVWRHGNMKQIFTEAGKLLRYEWTANQAAGEKTWEDSSDSGCAS